MVYTVSGVQYTRRKKIPVTGAASGAQTDYQIKLAATWAAAMQADFDDVRFTKADMQTLIDAWLESKVDSTTAEIWTEFPTTPANGVVKTEAYMYYGNSGVANYWDIFDTFVVGDDYTTKSPEPWTEVDPNSHIVIDRTTDHRLEMNGINRNEDAYTYIAKSIDSSILYVKCKVTTWTAGQVIGFGGISDTLNDTNAWQNGCRVYGYHSPHSISIGGMSGGSADYSSVGTSLNTDYWVKMVMDGTTATLYVYSDSARNNLVGSTSVTMGDVTYSYIYGTVSHNSGSNQPGSGIADDFRVCKYAANPPTAVFGTEEHQRRTPMMM